MYNPNKLLTGEGKERVPERPPITKSANIQGDTIPGKVGQAFLGNTFSGMYDLYQDATRPNGTGTIDVLKSLVLNGWRQGWPGGGAASKGVTGVVQDAVLKRAFQNLGMARLGGATVATAASVVGDLKIGYDALAFLYGVRQCTE